jgi:hypothetical protein
MSKIYLVFATAAVLASFSSNVAFAADSSQTAYAQGQAINLCRTEEQPGGSLNDHHDRLQRRACVQRILNDASN